MGVSFLFSISGVLGQQFSMECWHKGAVQLGDGTVVKGLLRYNLESDVVRFEMKNETFVFTANTINTFFFTDYLDSTKRSFITYQYTTSEDYKTPVFFEYLLDGKMPLLCREQIIFKPGGSSASAGFNGSSSRDLEYTFYFINLDGDVQRLPERRRKIATIFRGKEVEMKKYIKDHRFKLGGKKEMLTVFEYYYSLF